MSDAHAEISQKRRMSPIWIVPLVALALGIWMVIFTLQSQGPEITIVFSTAEGIEAGKTKIKLREVEIGLVESAGLGEDLESVVVKARIEKEAESLLREDTRFWVVRPRIGKGGISGLGTLLSGGYIQLAPGSSDREETEFVGLELPPVTPAGTPGVKLTIMADKAGSIGVADPILYKGYRVGWVETEEFDVETFGMLYGVFIEAPFDDLISTNARFWNVSGITFSAGANGIDVTTGSLESLLMGGLEVGLPLGVSSGANVEPGSIFHLYDSYAEVNERPYKHTIDYVVAFPQSVRGLLPGAPVEFRGLPVGRVERVMLTELTRGGLQGSGNAIPVLIRLEPARLELPDSPAGIEDMMSSIEESIGEGFRASLATGNLLTGSLYVSLDVYPNAPPAEQGIYRDLPTIPTIESGLGGIEQRITLLLDKLNDLPLDQAVMELEEVMANANALLGSEGMQNLPDSLDATIRQLQKTLASFSEDSELQTRLLPTITELDRTLASLREVLDTIDEQPNALIFNRAYREDPRPPAGAQ